MKQNGHLYLEQEILVKDALKVLNKELNLQPVRKQSFKSVISSGHAGQYRGRRE